MQHYLDSVTAFNGDKITNAAISVTTLAGNGVTIYLDADGLMPVSFVNTNSNGEFDFYIPVGRYNINVSGSGITPYSLLDVFIFYNVAPTFSAYGSVSQTVTTATLTKVVIDTEIFDTNSNFDNVTNYRFTPTVAGYYQVNGTLRGVASTVSESISIYLFKNGVSYLSGGVQSISTGTSTANALNVSEVIYLNGSTDYLELYGIVTGTGVCSFLNATSVNNCRFSASMIRGA